MRLATIRLATVRGPIFWVCACLMLAVFQYMIVAKERMLASGHSILLELAPLDPRSLMQGDYMQLNYTLNDALRNARAPAGVMIVKPDARHIARFVRIDESPSQLEGEYSIRFSAVASTRQRTLKPDSFFFQEGHAAWYERAKYGVFQCEDKGLCLLVGLAGPDGQMIRPEPGKAKATK